MQQTKFENEQARAMKEAEIQEFMKKVYLDRKAELLQELREINGQLEKL